MNYPVKLICFDLDDTLIKDIHSAMFPCILNGKEKEHLIIQKREEAGEIDYISADYLRAKLFKGLKENQIKKNFLKILKPLRNIEYVISELHTKGFMAIIITVGPKQVAKAACEIWKFDAYYGSDFEVINGVFTGNIIKYYDANCKVEFIKEFCKKNNITKENCIAVGDGATDIPVFEYCQKSIAINALPDVKKKATYFVDTDDLIDILKFI